ncbi:hypothetical protein FJY84_05085, partial [Candidatus Bathyarchaeota archaeon]|nr:hypothetical protein [Candidatus Bathyarchaeota archaeon]
FEVFVLDSTLENPEKALKVWNDLVNAGAKSCGLGSRDSLRLEAGLWLYGNEINEETNPVEAGLKWTVKMNKNYFIGKKAIQQVVDNGVTRNLVGLMLTERGIPRHGYEIYDGEKQIGIVTSGGMSPSLDAGIAMGYVPPEYKKIGTEISVKIRSNLVKGKVVKHRPFYDETKYGWKRNKP